MATEYVMQRDLEALRIEMRGEFALVRGEMASMEGRLRHEMGAIQNEIGGVRQELGRETGNLRGEFWRETGSIRQELGEIKAAIAAQPRKLFVANLATMIGLSALVLAAARFG